MLRLVVTQTLIRAYRPEDRDAVRRIAYDTAWLGKSIAGLYRDFESMADVLTGYYLAHEPENALVAEHSGRVVGYVLSCRDARKVPSLFATSLRHVLTRGVCFRPGTAGFYMNGLRDSLFDGQRGQRPALDLSHYSAHTHSNFVPEMRGDGVCTEMHWHLYDQLKAQGVRGLHAEVFTENQRAMHWVERKLGYSNLGEPYLVPGLRSERGERLHLQLVVRDLTGWEIGAWRTGAAHQTSNQR